MELKFELIITILILIISNNLNKKKILNLVVN
jgi:hypothetical protein